MSHVVITGAGVGNTANRLEIHDFVKDEKFFSLYIQALQRISSDFDQDNVESFFSVGGIHGLPNIPWDGAVGDTPFVPNSRQWGGYCTHGSVLFPTWHRPYVALFEQILGARALGIAFDYKVDRKKWLQAAGDLRQPYWDWALKALPPPQVIEQKQVTITNKDGKRVEVDNPLYHYKFHPIDPSFPSPYSKWQTTIRHPTSKDADATDDIKGLKSELESPRLQSSITSATYNTLTRVHTWPEFSNHNVVQERGPKRLGPRISNSLEAIHDNIHVNVGRGGQMSDPSVAGFDPIFYLHHANVDRLLSLWSALNPGVWVTPGIAEDGVHQGGSFTTPPGAPYDETTALTPFWDTQTTFWASAAITDTSKLGYSYPDFNGVDVSNPDATKTAISIRVNQLYGSSSFGNSFLAVPQSIPAPVSRLADTAKEVTAASSARAPSLAATKAVPASHSSAPSQQHPSSTQVTDQHINIHPSDHLTVVEQSSAPHHNGIWEWTARVEFKKYELGTSFSVLIFLGQVPEDPREWRISPNYVGGHHAFVNSAAGSCANCTNQQDLVVEGFVHLNHAIAQDSGLASLEPNVVEPYLTRDLQWRVQKADGEVAELQSLEVSVIATLLSLPPGTFFPVPGQTRRYNGITHGKAGGSRDA